MFGFGESTGAVQKLSWYLTRDVKMALVAGIVFSMPILPGLARLKERLARSRRESSVAFLEFPLAACQTIGLCLTLIVSVMFLSAGTHNPFIYFRF